MNPEHTTILEIIALREAAMLNPLEPVLMTAANPFRRKGITVADVAYAMAWVHPSQVALRSGRAKADYPRARKALKEMVKAGHLIEFGRERTLQCGSRPQTTWATPDYPEKIQKLLEFNK
jgi:hypothetical protein